MALKMKAACETCKTALPETSGKATICSYERTYCTACAKASGGTIYSSALGMDKLAFGSVMAASGVPTGRASAPRVNTS